MPSVTTSAEQTIVANGDTNHTMSSAITNVEQATVSNGDTHNAMPSTSLQRPKQLNIGVIGIGRIGRQHALNALHHVSSTNLVCICDVLPENLSWAAEHLEPYGVKAYQSTSEMLQHAGLEAVIIASPTHLHHIQLAESITLGLHVLCEKPLATTVAQTKAVLALAQQPQNTHLKIMTAYCRRFDASYAAAVGAIRAGKIGTPVVIRAENRDRYDDSPFYKDYLLRSPGIFVDSCIHDIDLTLSFLTGASPAGALPVPKSASAIGTIALHAELQTTGDVDNGVGMVEWWPEFADGVAPISYYHVSRIQAHGFDNPTEITGTKGILKINLHPRRDLVEVADSEGIANAVGLDFYGRYEVAFKAELEAFARAVLSGENLPYTLEEALRGMEIAEALQESLRTGEKVMWDEHGRRTDRCYRQNRLDHEGENGVGAGEQANGFVEGGANGKVSA